MFKVAKIKENKFRTIFDITADTGSYQAFVSDYNEVHVRKFDDEGMLDGEFTFDWNREKLDKMVEDFYTVLRILIENNLG